MGNEDAAAVDRPFERRVRRLWWGSYKGHLQHLFSATMCVQSECGTAYCGDSGLTTPSRRKLCKKCAALSIEFGIETPNVELAGAARDNRSAPAVQRPAE